MEVIIIKTNHYDNANKILGLLERAEQDGTLDFEFNVQQTEEKEIKWRYIDMEYKILF